MDSPVVETMLRIPWGAELPRSLVWYPERSELAGSDSRQSPAIPVIRVIRGGAIAALNHVGSGYLPAGTVRWWVQAPASAPVRARSAPYPFAADGDTATAVDFWVDDAGGLVLLERTAGADGRAGARLAVVSAAGELTRKLALDGPYVRLVPDDAGHLYLVSHQGSGALVTFDATAGQLGAPVALTPGTRAALVANRGAVIPARTLTGGDAARVAPAAGLPEALVFLFGIDGADNYDTVVGGELVSVTFTGQIRRRIPLTSVPALAPAHAGSGEILARPALPTAWQVDPDGRIYVPRVTPDEFQVVRLTP